MHVRFRCECGSTFVTQARLKHHRKYHCPLLETLDAPCPKCAKVYSCSENLTAHLKAVHT